jgi:hypothetical protein
MSLLSLIWPGSASAVEPERQEAVLFSGDQSPDAGFQDFRKGQRIPGAEWAKEAGRAAGVKRPSKITWLVF